MESLFEISIGHGTELKEFIIKDYEDIPEGKCKFEVYRLGKVILSLKSNNGTLQVCDNQGTLDEETVREIIIKIHAYYL